MGNTRNTGYLQNIVQYDASNNITLPAKLAITGTVAINNTTPYDTTQYSLDVNGGLIIKNINKTAQFVLINSNPATGGNNAFVVHTVGGTSGSSYADIQGYYGTSITGSTVLRLNPLGGNVLIGSLIGTGTRVVVADATGVLSTQAAQTIGDLNGVPTSRTITINGTTYDLSANRSWSITSMIYPGAGIAVSTGTAWGTSITDNSGNWNTAFGWGNHAGLYSLLNHTHTFASLTSKPTTLVGYGITDAATSAQGTNADTAFGWGNHASGGYVTLTGTQTISGVKTFSTYQLMDVAILIKHGSNTSTGGYTGIGSVAAGLTINLGIGTTASLLFNTSASYSYTFPAASGTIALTSDLSTYATQTYVGTQIANLVASSPAALDTLNELATALGNDAAFSTTVSTALGNRLRVDIDTQGLSATLQGYGRTNLGLGTAATSATGDFATASHTHYTSSLNWEVYSVEANLPSAATKHGMFTHVHGTGSAYFAHDGAWKKLLDTTNMTSGNVTTALGFTPYNATNPSAYIALAALSFVAGSGAYNNTTGVITIPTNNNQLTNGAGYITGYTETDTLASVTGRGNTTTSSMAIGSGSIPNGKLYVNSGSGSDVVALQNTLNTGAYLVFADNVTPTWANAPRLGAISNDMVFKTLDTERFRIASTGASTFTGPSLTINTTGDIVANGDTFRMKGGGGSAEFIWYRNYSGSPSEPGFNINNRAGVTTFSHNVNGGGTSVSGNFSAANFSGSSSGTNTGDQTNISGNAATAGTSTYASYLNALGSYVWSHSSTPSAYHLGITSSFVSGTEGFQSYGSVMTMKTYSGGGGSLQLYVPYSSTYGGSAVQVRFGNYDVSSGNSWTSWKTLIDSGNIGSQTVASAGNATTAGGLAVHTGTNNVANQIVRTDVNGYIQAGWINTISGDNGTSALTRIYASDDAYLRFYTPANFRQVLDVPTRTGGSASGSWSINAATATSSSQLGGLTKSQLWNNSGNSHGAFTSFAGPSDFGNYFIHQDAGVNDGPAGNLYQYYSTSVGLGNDYSYSQYVMQTAVNRYGYGTPYYTWVRFKESGTWQGWNKMAAGYADSAGSLSSMNISQFTNNSGYVTTSGLSTDADSEQTVGGRVHYFNSGAGRMNVDPRWNESGYDADNGCLHIWSWTAAGVAYGRAGIALFSDTAYQYLTTKSGTTGIFLNNNAILHAGNYTSYTYSTSSANSTFSRKDTTSQWMKPYYEYGNYLTNEAPSTLTSQMGGGGLRVDFAGSTYTADGSWSHVITFSGYNRYSMSQIGTNYNTTDARLYYRQTNAHTDAWLGWKEMVFTTGNTPSIMMSGPIRRASHSSGFFEGSYNNVGGNSAYSNPIYTIGSAYNPSDSSLGVMYGIGYAHPNFWGGGKTSSWGMYCANGGVINVTLGEGSTSIWAQNDIVAYSDLRVKDNIEVIDNALEKIQAIRGVTFTRKDAVAADINKRHAGVIAQEVLTVLPEVVSGTEEDMYSVAYGNMAALFIEAIKEQQTQIESQKSEIDVLKDLVQQLINR
jgi:hypothetical protein